MAAVPAEPEAKTTASPPDASLCESSVTELAGLVSSEVRSDSSWFLVGLLDLAYSYPCSSAQPLLHRDLQLSRLCP
jgi:hypothetical protein